MPQNPPPPPRGFPRAPQPGSSRSDTESLTSRACLRYGVCYAFMDDEYLLMHISSRRSTTRTNSERMMAAVQQAFDDMVALKDALGQPQAEAQPQPQPQPQPQDTQQ